jgi:hypothetical protein
MTPALAKLLRFKTTSKEAESVRDSFGVGDTDAEGSHKFNLRLADHLLRTLIICCGANDTNEGLSGKDVRCCAALTIVELRMIGADNLHPT